MTVRTKKGRPDGRPDIVKICSIAEILTNSHIYCHASPAGIDNLFHTGGKSHVTIVMRHALTENVYIELPLIHICLFLGLEIPLADGERPDRAEIRIHADGCLLRAMSLDSPFIKFAPLRMHLHHCGSPVTHRYSPCTVRCGHHYHFRTFRQRKAVIQIRISEIITIYSKF